MALNYPFVYCIFSWCAKGIVILMKKAASRRSGFAFISCC
ncbi:hypothetical protein CUS_4424 [Ruminococcus albus 8]|uniref:Uncharacterized protein n=1 Tax=Ruminococcus albus 8 TaxID=246199 RepID=E9S787_RUMAL|nr:hypothetical protein CUS_4424 [Ruminococcus albus 8]